MQFTWLYDGTDTGAVYMALLWHIHRCSLHGSMMAQTQVQSTWLHDGTDTGAVYMAP
jgi:hypothetical protein